MHFLFQFLKLCYFYGWRGSPVVKGTDCSFKESRLNSQLPHNGSEPSVTLVPGGLVLLLVSVGTADTRYTGTDVCHPLKAHRVPYLASFSSWPSPSFLPEDSIGALFQNMKVLLCHSVAPSFLLR